MKSQDLTKPIVPVVYGLLILDLARERGIARGRVVAGLQVPDRVWATPDARISLVQLGGLLLRAMQLSGDGALGYEIGLHCGPTLHGLFGFGAMSFASLRQTLDFGIKFLPVRLPNVQLRMIEEGRHCALEVTEATPLGPLRQQTIELTLVGAWHLAVQLLGRHPGPDSGVELWFDFAEPEYYPRYRERLPPARFGMGGNRLCFPVELLDRPLRTFNPVNAEIVQQQCERELKLLGLGGDFLQQVREALTRPEGGYRSVDEVCACLCLSNRTLKRRLQEHSVSFQQLLDETRQRDSMTLLRDATLKIEEVAQRLAYADSANFTRAFRKWTGTTPSAFRTRLMQAGGAAR